MKVYVVTGPSSCGKSSLIEHLNQRGFPVIREISRSVLLKGVLHPHKNPFTFEEEVARRQFEEEKKVRILGGEAAFLDRGLCDISAFCRHLGVGELPQPLQKKIHYDAVFVLDALPSFENDGIRIEKDQEEAAHINEMIVEEYKKREIPCVRVPAMPIEKRADFVLDRIKYQS